MVLVLEAEFSDRQMDKAIVIGLKAMPLHQDVKQSHRIPEMAFEIGPNSMRHFLEVTHGRQHRQHDFNQHAGIPLTSLAEFQVGGLPVLLVKAPIAEDQHVIGDTVDQPLKRRPVIDVGGIASPAHDQTQVVEQHTVDAS